MFQKKTPKLLWRLFSIFFNKTYKEEKARELSITSVTILLSTEILLIKVMEMCLMKDLDIMQNDFRNFGESNERGIDG